MKAPGDLDEMHGHGSDPPVLLEEWATLGGSLGVELFAVRDDLLPFPFAGNKYRKLVAELDGVHEFADVIISVGAVDSNHCRTVGWLAARFGIAAHLVLHDELAAQGSSPALEVLVNLGATYSVGPANTVRDRVTTSLAEFQAKGLRTHVVPGGCHTSRGALAYKRAAVRALSLVEVDVVYVASGTGATQGGIHAGVTDVSPGTDVVGVSVARGVERGKPEVEEAVRWAGGSPQPVLFDDSFVAGGYGKSSPATARALEAGWRRGIPLDSTYTGKAMAALMHHAEAGQLDGKRVLFWHTGGLWNRVTELLR